MLSNLINEAQTPSKKNKAGLNENSINDQNLPLWKCNLDAFLNNPGITYIIRIAWDNPSYLYLKYYARN